MIPAQTATTVPEANATSSFLEFYSWAGEETSSEFGNCPYDFTVSGPLHRLTVNVNGETVGSYAATTGGGGLGFPLSLPEALIRGQRGIRRLTRGPTGSTRGWKPSSKRS